MIISRLVTKQILEDFVNFLRTIYNDEEICTIIVEYGPIYDFIEIKLDFSVHRKLKVNTVNYTQNIVNDFEKLEYVPSKLANAPNADYLLKIYPECPKLDIKIKKNFYVFTAKFFLCKRARPEIQMTVKFLTTRVMEPDENDWKICIVC